MRSDRPNRIRLCYQTEEEDPDPDRGRYVGTARDGRRFFITAPFHPAVGTGPFVGHDFVALYLWDSRGEFLSAEYRQIGTRGVDAPSADKTLAANRYPEAVSSLLEFLGPVAYGDIDVAPFAMSINGVEFGLVPRAPEDDDDTWTVRAMPGDYMCWYPPWDGFYDT